MRVAESQFVKEKHITFQMQGILHDMGNMLHGITGYIELAAMQLDSNNPEKIGESLQRAMVAGTQAINFFHLMSKSMVISEPFSGTFVAEIVEETVDFLSQSFPAEIEIQKNIKKSHCPVKTLSATVYQVAMNLIINALQSMEGRGVLRVHVDTVVFNNPCICLNDCLSPGHYSKVVVEDTGCGIPPEILGRIFEPYFTTKSQGHGIGLAMVKKNLQQCGGGIRVQSVPEKGTRFEVFFPHL